MKNKPLVSVLIPTYNRPKYLSRAIDSCLNQTYDNIEIIVIDDNNPETEGRIETEKLMKDLYGKNDKVKYIQLEKNSGACIARNYGIEKSLGEYITFLDDDDEYYPNNIEEELKFITKHNYDMIFCNIEYINDITKEKSKNVYVIDFEPTTANFLRRQLLNGISGAIGYMYKASVLKAIEGFTNIKSSQEYILLLKTIGAGYNVGHFDFIGSIGHFVDSPNKITGSKKAIEGKKQARKIARKYYYILTLKEKRLVEYQFNTFIFRQYFKHKDIRALYYGLKQLFYLDFVIKNKKRK